MFLFPASPPDTYTAATTAAMRAQCEIVRDMVSSVLGAEAAEQLLSSDKPNLHESFAVFQAVFDAVEAQSKEASLGFKRVADSIAAHKKA